MLNHSPRILIIGPAWVGDMVMAQSLFISLKQQQPECRIDVLAPLWTLSILKRMPEVTNSIGISLKHGEFGFGYRKKIGRSLQDNNYQRAIVLPNSWKSALIPLFAGIPCRTGYIGEFRWGLLNDSRKLDKQKLPKTVERFVALGSEKNTALPVTYPFPRLRIQPSDQQTVKRKYQITGDMKTLGICPGAEYGPAKRWPAEFFGEVANHYIAMGWRILLFGSEKDRTITQQINQSANSGCLDLSGRTTMAEAVDLMSLTDCVVTNDSGLMHVAAALDKNVVAIFGSSDPDFTPPLSSKATVMSLRLDCSPCFKRECPFGHYRCLNEITPHEVLDAVNESCASSS